MKRIHKILVVLLLGVTLVVPSLVVSNVKVGAYYTISGTFGKTRFTAGSTSDTMILELETDRGWVNTVGGGATLAGLSTNFSYYYGSKIGINYILTAPISLYNSIGELQETYPIGSIMNINPTDITFFDSNYTMLTNFVNNVLVGYYLQYDIYLNDYFIAYNQGYNTGSSQGYNQGQLHYGYYDNVTNTWLTATEYALLRYNDGVSVGNSDGFTTGYIEGVTEAYNNGYFSAYAKYMYTPLISLVETLSYSYELGYDEGFLNNIYYDDGYQEGVNDGIGTAFENGFNGLSWDDVPLNDNDSYSYGRGTQATQEEAYDKGFLDGGKNSFMGSFDKWIVPAIIIVIVVGGALSIMAMKRRGD